MLFSVDHSSFALPLDEVDKVYPMAKFTYLPGLPECVSGILNVHGEMMAVFNIRRKFRLTEKTPILSDQLIVVQTARGKSALMADDVQGVLEIDQEQIIRNREPLEADPCVEGIVRRSDGMIIIQNPEKFLSSKEEAALIDAIEKG